MHKSVQSHVTIYTTALNVSMNSYCPLWWVIYSIINFLSMLWNNQKFRFPEIFKMVRFANCKSANWISIVFQQFSQVVCYVVLIVKSDFIHLEFKGCVHYIFANLFCMSKGKYFWNVFYYASKALFILLIIKF